MVRISRYSEVIYIHRINTLVRKLSWIQTNFYWIAVTKILRHGWGAKVDLLPKNQHRIYRQFQPIIIILLLCGGLSRVYPIYIHKLGE